MLKTIGLCAGALLLLGETSVAQAEITVLDKNQQSSALLSPLSLQVGGSIRPEWIFSGGDAPGYYKNGHDGGSRIRFSADYALSKQTSLVGYYEWGIDIPHIVDWSGHYDVEGPREHQRQMYVGIKDDTYGTLTYGHQFGLYYSVIGIKSDVWDNDGHAGGAGVGLSGDFDGGNRPKRSLNYTKDFGSVILYANYLFPEGNLDSGNNLYYRRTNGGGIGADYKMTPDLTLSAAYSLTAAKMGRVFNRLI